MFASQLPRAVATRCADDTHEELLDRLDQALDPEATAAGSAAFVSRTRACFAVRSGVDGMLDMARTLPRLLSAFTPRSLKKHE